MPTDNRKNLYDYLKNNGRYDDNYSEFSKNIDTPKGRRALYDYMVSEGLYDGDWAEFHNNLNKPEDTERARKQAEKAVTGSVGTPADMPLRESKGTVTTGKTAGDTVGAVAGKVAETPANTVGNTTETVAMRPEYDLAGRMKAADRQKEIEKEQVADPTSKNYFAENKSINEKRKELESKGGVGRIMADADMAASMGKKADEFLGGGVKLETPKFDPFMTKVEPEDYADDMFGTKAKSEEVQERVQERLNDRELTERLSSQMSNVTSMLNEAHKKEKEQVMSTGGMTPYDTMGESMILEAADRNLRDAQRMVDAANRFRENGSKSDLGSFLKDAGISLVDRLTDFDNWDFGMSNMHDAYAVKDMFDKFDKGGEDALTESEKALLDAVSMKTAIGMYYGESGVGNQVGTTTAEMIPFMIEMIVNPASGIGQATSSAVGRQIAKYAAKRFLKKGVEEVSKTAFTAGQRALMGAAKYGSRVLADIGAGYVMSGTTGLANVMADTYNRMQGDVIADEKGEYQGRTEGEDFGSAFSKAMTVRAIENQSEFVGNYFKPLLGFLGSSITTGAVKGVNKVVRNEAIKQSLIGAGKAVARVADGAKKNAIGKYLTAMNKYAKYDGPIGEYMEEVVGNFEKAMLGIDMDFSSEKGKGMFNLEDNWATFLSVAVPGVAQAIVSTGAFVRNEMKSADTKLQDENAAMVIGGDAWEAIKSDLNIDYNGTTDAIVKQALAKAREFNLNAEETRALMKYVNANVFSNTWERTKNAKEEEDEDTLQIGIDEANAYGKKIRGNGEKMREAGGNLQQSVEAMQQMPEVKYVIDQYSAGEASIKDVSKAIEGLDAEKKDIASKYLYSVSEIDGVMQSIKDKTAEAADEARAKYMPFARQDENGNNMVTTAKLNGEDVFVSAYDMGNNVLYVYDVNDNGETVVKERYLKDNDVLMGINTKSVDEIAQEESARVRNEIVDEAQWQVNYSPKVQRTFVPGTDEQNGTVIDTMNGKMMCVGVDDVNGAYIFKKAEVDSRTGLFKGVGEDVVMSEEEAWDAQEDVYGQGKVENAGSVGTPATPSGEAEVKTDEETTETVAGTEAKTDDGVGTQVGVLGAEETLLGMEGGELAKRKADEYLNGDIDEGELKSQLRSIGDGVLGAVSAYIEEKKGRDEAPSVEVEVTPAIPVGEAEGTVAEVPAGEAAGTDAEMVEEKPQMVFNGDEPDFAKSGAEATRGYLYDEEQSGLDKESADVFVENNLNAAKRALDKANKAKSSATNMKQFNEENAKIKAEREKAQKEVDLWEGVKNGGVVNTESVGTQAETVGETNGETDVQSHKVSEKQVNPTIPTTENTPKIDKEKSVKPKTPEIDTYTDSTARQSSPKVEPKVSSSHDKLMSIVKKYNDKLTGVEDVRNLTQEQYDVASQFVKEVRENIAKLDDGDESNIQELEDAILLHQVKGIVAKYEPIMKDVKTNEGLTKKQYNAAKEYISELYGIVPKGKQFTEDMNNDINEIKLLVESYEKKHNLNPNYKPKSEKEKLNIDRKNQVDAVKVYDDIINTTDTFEKVNIPWAKKSKKMALERIQKIDARLAEIENEEKGAKSTVDKPNVDSENPFAGQFDDKDINTEANAEAAAKAEANTKEDIVGQEYKVGDRVMYNNMELEVKGVNKDGTLDIGGEYNYMNYNFVNTNTKDVRRVGSEESKDFYKKQFAKKIKSENYSIDFKKKALDEFDKQIDKLKEDILKKQLKGQLNVSAIDAENLERLLGAREALVESIDWISMSPNGLAEEVKPNSTVKTTNEPKYAYYVNVGSGGATLHRDMISEGSVPVGDKRFEVHANSAEGLIKILENPANKMSHLLDLPSDKFKTLRDEIHFKDRQYKERLAKRTNEAVSIPLSEHGTLVIGKPGIQTKEEIKPIKEEKKRLVSDERREELIARMKAKLNGQLNIGIDPELLSIGAELAVSTIERGATKFIDYAKELIDILGDAVRPYLKSFYNAVRDMPEAAQMGLEKQMDSYKTVSEVDVTTIGRENPNPVKRAKEMEDERKVSIEAEKTPVKALQNGEKVVNSQDEADKSISEEERKARDRFVTGVSNKMRVAMTSGEKPFDSIVEIRKYAAECGMGIDGNNTDILIQELVETALVGAARRIITDNKYGEGLTRKHYDAICKLYELQPTISMRSGNRIKMQQYSTPLPMGFLADKFVDKNVPGSVLEPTAGNGMLVFALPISIIHANELDKTRLENLKGQGFGKVTNQDATEPFEIGKKYDAIVANPPFGSSEAKSYDGKLISGLDPQITLNALESMADNGRAAIIIGGNIEYATNGSIKSKKAFFSYLYDHYNVKGIVDMGGDLYKKQGTSYPTMMILIDGRRSEEERAMTTCFPPIKDKAVRRADTFDDLYDIIEEVINDNRKTNGTEVLRSQQPVLDSKQQEWEGNGKSDKAEHQKNDGVGKRGQKPENDSKMGAAGIPGESGQTTGTGTSKPNTSPVGQTGNGGSGRPNVERVSGVGASGVGNGLDNKPKKEPEQRKLGQEKLPYIHHSKGYSLESVAPASMVEAMDKTLKKIEAEYGEIDGFVQRELGYDTVDELYGALAAEQIDSVAMAIAQMKKGQAIIIGDQTGVGKGRQMAALIRWARKQGKRPVFMTKTADLFSDIYRDLADIGSGDLRPFIFNSVSSEKDEEGNSSKVGGVMKDANGQVVYEAPSPSKQKKIFESGVLPEEYDYAVLTYSQVNTGDEISKQEALEAAKRSGKPVYKKKNEGKTRPTTKATFLRNIVADNYMLMDESHTAAGEGNTGAYMQSIVRTIKACTFASATFAKRTDTMPLYALKTAMSAANVEASELIKIIEKGGVTLQEIMSRALSYAGQMVRRERDMSDVVTDWKIVDNPEIVKKARENYDNTIKAFNAIIKFQEDYVNTRIDSDNASSAIVMNTVTNKKGTKEMGISNEPFASKTYNYTKQLMLALKVSAIVDEVEKQIKAGLRPVIALDSTMESALSNYDIDEEVGEPTFGLSLIKGLNSCLQYTITDAEGQQVSGYYSPKDLGPEGEREYYRIREMIKELTKDVFVSPLDAITISLKEKGYKVGELTGRKKCLVYEDGKYVVRKRVGTDKNKLAREFNSGELDVLILNKSASTGISLHAHKNFADNRQRCMIVAQPLSDIADYMQMIGRIDRTGQIYRGYYINLGLPVPAENRFLMMLSTKLKSLNANTTSAQESKDNKVEAPDILNKYGSRVVVEYFRDHPEIYIKLGDPLRLMDGDLGLEETLNEYKAGEDTARKLTGYVALLTTKEQEDFYDDVTQRYEQLISYLNDSGENDLKITVMPLRAETISKKISSKGVDPSGDNPFAGNAYVEQVEIDVLKKPMKAEEVRKLIANISTENPAEHISRLKQRVKDIYDAKRDTERERYEKALARAEERIAKFNEKTNGSEKMTDGEKAEAIKENRDRIIGGIENEHEHKVTLINTEEHNLTGMLGMFKIGETYLMPDVLDNAAFMSTSPSVFCGFKAKDKMTPSTTYAVFAVLDGRRRIELPLSQYQPLAVISTATTQNYDSAKETNLNNWDGKISNARRKTGYILTGNIIQAVSDSEDAQNGGYIGQLISFTDIDGNIRDGILMPDKWTTSNLKGSGSPIIARIDDIRSGRSVTSTDGKVSVGPGSWGKYVLEVPKTKKEGQKYFDDDELKSLVEYGDFYQRGNIFYASIKSDNLVSVLNRLSQLGVKVVDKKETSIEKSAGEYEGTTEADRQVADVVVEMLDGGGVPVKYVSNDEAEAEVENGGIGTQYSIREKPAPKKVKKVYKLMRLGKDGKLYPLFIDSAIPIELKKWYDAVSPDLSALKGLASGIWLIDNKTNQVVSSYDDFYNEHRDMFKKKKTIYPSVDAVNWATDNGYRFMLIEDTKKAQKRFDGEKRKYWNLGINGSGKVDTFSMRPGWHAGSLPTMRQIGKGTNKNLRDDTFVWVEGYVSADIDYNEEARKNKDKDIPDRIPEDGFYLKATNADKKKSQADLVGWYVAGSFMADRIISDVEAREIIDEWNEDHEGKKVEYDYERESGKTFFPDKGLVQLKAKNGVVYGYVKDGVIYLNRDAIKGDTPIHEYTHIWDKALQQTNPELWKKGVELMKQTSMWEEVMKDENYSGIWGDEDLVASEVHSRLTGKKGADRLKEMAEEVLNSNTDPLTKAKKLSVIEKLKNWLKEFWWWTKDTFTKWGARDIKKVSLDDFVMMPLKDLANGVNPRKRMRLFDTEGDRVTMGSYFTGAGLLEEGLRDSIDPRLAVEYSADIAGVYVDNFGNHIITADVRDIDLEELAKEKGKIQYFHASPVCKRASKANVDAGETEIDKETAKSTADAIGVLKPKIVTIENVPDYKNFEAMNIILDKLKEIGYTYEVGVYNSKNFGSPMNRERLIIRASLDGNIPEPIRTAESSGWYDSVKDLIPSLPDSNGLAEWQKERFERDGIDWKNTKKPILVYGNGSKFGSNLYAFADEAAPSLTTKAGSGARIILPGGIVKEATPRVFARLMGLGDDFQLPGDKTLAYQILGNGIPTELTKGVIAPLVDTIKTTEETDGTDGNTQFSIGSRAEEVTSAEMRRGWDALAGSVAFQLRETAVDYLTAVKKFQDYLSEKLGFKVKDYEDAHQMLVKMSGRNKAEMDFYQGRLVPMLVKAMKDLAGKKGNMAALEEYVYVKHGIERNRQVSVERYAAKKDDEEAISIMSEWDDCKALVRKSGKTWLEQQRDLDYYAEELGVSIDEEEDKISGLSSMFPDADNWKEAAYNAVESYENTHDADKVNGLWDAIRMMTDFALYKWQDSGLVNEDYVKTQKDRFDYYVPLRGFNETLAQDIYDYVGNEYGGFNPVKTMKGRSSRAGDVFGGIIELGTKSIITGNKNLAKMRFLNLVEGHDTKGLATVSNTYAIRYADIADHPEVRMVYLEPDEEAPEWVVAVPNIPVGADPKEMQRVLSRFEDLMKSLKREGKVVDVGKAGKVDYRTLYNQKNEHQVYVKVGGKTKIVTINGDPRVAQSINGLLNPNNTNENGVFKFLEDVRRFTGGMFTSYNMAFSISNLMRDTQFTMENAFIRNNTRYLTRFMKNRAKNAAPWVTTMFGLYKAGKLDESNYTERMFKEFLDNGGATGYTFTENQKDYADKVYGEIESLITLDGQGKKIAKSAFMGIFRGIQFVTESSEIVNRFATYVTSREMGRSITRSIEDSADNSLNFEQKGAGAKTKGKGGIGQKMLVNTLAGVTEYSRRFILFFNAMVQGKYIMLENFKKHPYKTSTIEAGKLLMGGLMMPLINNLALPALYSVLGIGGDDDEKDYQDLLDDYTRQNNICIRLPKNGGFLTIPVEPEGQALYELGDKIRLHLTGRRDILGKDGAKALVDLSVPYNVNWNYEDMKFLTNFAPSVFQPVLQLTSNRNFLNRPIYVVDQYGTRAGVPQYRMVLKNASTSLVELSKWMNELGGGDEVLGAGAKVNDRGGVSTSMFDWNPGKLYHLIQGYTGGFGTTIISMADAALALSNGEEFELAASKQPFVSRFYEGNSDAEIQKRMYMKYRKPEAFYDLVKSTLNRYKKEAKDETNPLLKAEKVERLRRYMDSEDYGKYLLLMEEGHILQIKELEKQRKKYEGHEEVVKNINKQIAINIPFVVREFERIEASE